MWHSHPFQSRERPAIVVVVMRPRWIHSIAMFLALVPVTLLVPGLDELVVTEDRRPPHTGS